MGAPILDALLADGSFTVTVLVRAGSKSKLPAGVRTVEVDFSSADSLTEALRGQHAAINATSAPVPEDHVRFADAARTAGVYRLIPAYFGLEAETTLGPEFPVFAPKAAVVARLREFAPEGSASDDDMTWTLIAPGCFLDWNIATGFMGINVRARTAAVTSGGDLAAPHTLLRDVARATAAVLRRPAETRNRQVYVQSVVRTQNELIALARRALGEEAGTPAGDAAWTVTAEDARERYDWALAQLAAGNYEHDVWMHQIRYAVAEPRYSGPWKGLDNELLGIREMSDEEVMEMVRTLVREDKTVY